jgi:hypothetical protein
MKLLSMMLFLLFAAIMPAHGMDHGGNHGKKNFWQNWRLKYLNFDVRQKSKNIYSDFNDRYSNASQIIMNRYGKSFRRPYNQPTENNMRKFILGAAGDYEEVQVTFKTLSPWYKKNPFKLAALVGAGGFLVGTVFGWKTKTYFTKKNSI